MPQNEQTEQANHTNHTKQAEQAEQAEHRGVRHKQVLTDVSSAGWPAGTASS